jgi:DNA-binding FrmR family transcriptional regulator
MLAEQRDCDDILTQVAGVKAAVNQVAILLLEGHLETCVSEAIRSGDGTAALDQFKNSLSRVLK